LVVVSRFVALLRSSTALLALFSVAIASAAEVPVEMPAPPTVAAVSIEGDTPPVIDGDISDPIWSRAKVIALDYQFEPLALIRPTERTEAWVLYDHDKLYIAVKAHSRPPQQLAVTTMGRDTPLRNDDVIRVLLDPRRTGREGYQFSVNPAGARMDALIPADRNQDVTLRWNTVWQVRSQVQSDGWSAEYAIPFRGLSYNPNDETWGFDITRAARISGESMRWAAVPLGSRQVELGYAGTLTGLRGLSQGRGLDLQLYGKATATRDWETGKTSAKGKPSATLYYKFTPSLTGLLTTNTDFSERPLDTRQVNTTRFSLFEPETREFFLEDVDAFEFAAFGNGSAANGKPFFSRNIGLVRGRPVNLDIGAKLSGDIGGLRIGALSVRTANENGVAAQTLSVVRLARQVLGESRVGAIMTSGDPTGLSRNQVAGVDFQFRRSDFRPGKRLDVVSYAQRSYSDVRPDASAFGVAIDYPNQPWEGTLRFNQLGEHFRPALGFVNRAGIRQYEGEAAYVRHQSNSYLRRLRWGAFEQMFNGLDNRLQSRNDRLSLEIETNVNGQISAGVDNYVEVLPAAFLLADTLSVPAGRQEYARPYAGFTSSTTRPWSAAVKVICCDYFNGRSTETEFELAYRPGPRLNVVLKHKMQTLRLPSGSATINIESLNTIVNFSPFMKLIGDLQYDNVSNRFSGLLRYQWEIKPTTELLATVGETAILTGAAPHARYQSLGTVFSLRFGHRLQF
jgi:hypothetical protein